MLSTYLQFSHACRVLLASRSSSIAEDISKLKLSQESVSGDQNRKAPGEYQVVALMKLELSQVKSGVWASLERGERSASM